MDQRLVELSVQGVYSHTDSESTEYHFVLFNSVLGLRLPIWIGQYEAWAIAFALDGKQPEYPMTHDALLLVLEALGGDLLEGRITALHNEVFHGAIHIRVGDQIKEIPMRLSDVVALAVRKKCPIFTTEEILLMAGRDD